MVRVLVVVAVAKPEEASVEGEESGADADDGDLDEEASDEADEATHAPRHPADVEEVTFRPELAVRELLQHGAVAARHPVVEHAGTVVRLARCLLVAQQAAL